MGVDGTDGQRQAFDVMVGGKVAAERTDVNPRELVSGPFSRKTRIDEKTLKSTGFDLR